MQEAVERGIKYVHDEIRIPIVWYREGDKFVVGILKRGRYEVELKIEEGIEISTDDMVGLMKKSVTDYILEGELANIKL